MISFFTAPLFVGLVTQAATDVSDTSVGTESCVGLVKDYLRSSEYNSSEAMDQILQACKDADTKCIRQIGDSLSSGERSEANKFLPLVKGCKGKGKGDCYQAILEGTPSFDRASADQAQKLLKKCE